MIDILLTGADLSRTVDVPAGQAVTVTLEDVSTTGYFWTATADADGASIVDDGVEPGEAPGASGLRRFAVTPHGSGRLTVHFRLQRPWQADAAPEREATVTLNVR